MDNIFKFCGFIGICAFVISSCSAVPKYDTASKRWFDCLFGWLLLFLSDSLIDSDTLGYIEHIEWIKVDRNLNENLTNEHTHLAGSIHFDHTIFSPSDESETFFKTIFFSFFSVFCKKTFDLHVETTNKRKLLEIKAFLRN